MAETTTTTDIHPPMASQLRDAPMITRAEALAFIDDRHGKYFAVKFVKRTPPHDVRQMSCRQGVKVHLAGGSPAYDFASKGLIPIYDTVKKDYRSIPTEGIFELMIDQVWHTVVGE